MMTRIKLITTQVTKTKRTTKATKRKRKVIHSLSVIMLLKKPQNLINH